MGQVPPMQHSLWRSHPSSLMIHPLWCILITSFPSYSLSPSVYHELSTIAYLSIFHEACIHPLYGLSSYLSIYHEPSILCFSSFYPSNPIHPSLHLDLVSSLVIGIKHKGYPNVNPLAFSKTFQNIPQKSKKNQNIQKSKKIKIFSKIQKIKYLMKIQAIQPITSSKTIHSINIQSKSNHHHHQFFLSITFIHPFQSITSSNPINQINLSNDLKSKSH